MAKQDHSPQIVRQTCFYGGSDNTSTANEVGLKYVKANSKAKSDYLGEIDETHLELMGDIGADMGRPSAFCCFRVSEPKPVRLIRIPGPRPDQLIDETDIVKLESQLKLQQKKHYAKHVWCGLSDRFGNGYGLDDQGWTLKPVSPGEVFITITTQSYPTIPFRVQLIVGSPLVQVGSVQVIGGKPRLAS